MTGRVTHAGGLTAEERALVAGAAERIVAEVLAECVRQYGEEGYNAKHDEAHPPAEFALAGAAYAFSGAQPPRLKGQPLDWPVRNWICQHLWPWWSDQFKPKDQRRDLVRAAALLVRGIQRIDRDAIAASDVEAA